MNSSMSTGRAPKQARSLQTHNRILDATEELIRERPFQEASNLSIANAAGIAAGSLYSRFPKRELLLAALIDRLMERAESRLEYLQTTYASNEPGDIVANAHVTVREFIRFSRDNQHILSSFEGDESILIHRRRFERSLTNTIRDSFIEHLPAAMSDGLSTKVTWRAELAMRIVASAVHRAIGPPVEWAKDMGIDDDQLAAELTKMAVGYFVMGESMELKQLAPVPYE